MTATETGSFGCAYLSKLCKSLDIADTVVDTWDRYDNENLVKTQEREQRGERHSRKKYQVIAGHAVPPWQKFLSLSSNKSDLALFVGDYVAEHAPSHIKLQDISKMIIISEAYEDGQITKYIDFNGSHVSERECVSHEEADTCMIFHACQADKKLRERGQVGRVIIKSPDTDVLVLAIHYFAQLKNVEELWFETGRVTRTTDQHRYIAVHEICKAYRPWLPQILPAVHAITGCDSASFFFKLAKGLC